VVYDFIVNELNVLQPYCIYGISARVTQKAKKDWCMALTHGLEHICENKPKEKKARKKKVKAMNLPNKCFHFKDIKNRIEYGCESEIYQSAQ